MESSEDDNHARKTGAVLHFGLELETKMTMFFGQFGHYQPPKPYSRKQLFLKLMTLPLGGVMINSGQSICYETGQFYLLLTQQARTIGKGIGIWWAW